MPALVASNLDGAIIENSANSDSENALFMYLPAMSAALGLPLNMLY